MATTIFLASYLDHGGGADDGEGHGGAEVGHLLLEVLVLVAVALGQLQTGKTHFTMHEVLTVHSFYFIRAKAIFACGAASAGLQATFLHRQ